MKKIMLLFSVLLVMFVTLIIPGCKAAEPEVIELKFAYAMPPMAYDFENVQVAWAKGIEEATHGRLKITWFPGESLVKERDQYDATVSGVVDGCQLWTAATPGRFPRADIGYIPMMYPSAKVSSRVYYELMEKYGFDTEFKNVKFLYVTGFAPSHIQSQKPVRTIEDFKGLRVAVDNEILAWGVEAMGATPVSLPTMDWYMGLERGTIDSVVFGWEALFAFKVIEVTKYRVDCPYRSVCAPTIMNLDVWKKLPGDVKKVIEEHSGVKFSENTGATIDEHFAGVKFGVIDVDKKMGNPGIYELPKAEKERWKQALMPIWNKWADEMEAKGLPGRAILKDAVELVEKYSK